jgi:hypothetical protein
MNRGEGTGEFHDFVQRGGSLQIVRRSSEFVESDEVELTLARLRDGGESYLKDPHGQMAKGKLSIGSAEVHNWSKGIPEGDAGRHAQAG